LTPSFVKEPEADDDPGVLGKRGRFAGQLPVDPSLSTKLVLSFILRAVNFLVISS
jgi:hypothetical protein